MSGKGDTQKALDRAEVASVISASSAGLSGKETVKHQPSVRGGSASGSTASAGRAPAASEGSSG
eukprot:CAMPEP_0173440438 /NCGR_PEP_ID=MMETSP1357-20121228/22862_1 /TAXON_ID=77926 /ORGANISM="Hemiselmis rufescens, Strain PCC563" /LENGTH=63 /DNA_ID=CAMNT_0014405915 /DNA_START=235 /DNA_END=422 /DNA_ORIENTATION=-